MPDNKVQFAVVREDPMVEAELVRLTNASNVLLIASGGCTALTLQALFPDLHITLVDFNPAQLERVREKMSALHDVDAETRCRRFNIETNDPKGLNQRGNFESLFRGLREFIFDLVADEAEIRALFEEEDRLARVSDILFSSKYWSVAFDLYFSDSLLNAMFGPDATQHAEAGSYPRYFQTLFEKGLTSAGAFDNYFLHHVFLGYYLQRCASLPYYLLAPPTDYRFQMVEGTLDALPELQRFDLISVSNIMDWMPLTEITSLIGYLQNEMRAGANVLYRQLNNYTDLSTYFGDAFEFDAALGIQFQESERSLFYSSVHVGKRR
jgi:S-adenosylmethionine-diacylglycerol 3-amino-3-carboxypropyl transferase